MKRGTRRYPSALTIERTATRWERDYWRDRIESHRAAKPQRRDGENWYAWQARRAAWDEQWYSNYRNWKIAQKRFADGFLTQAEHDACMQAMEEVSLALQAKALEAMQCST